MFRQTPPMGWNSWNTFGANINEQLIKEMTDALVSTGLRDAGYEYVIIDDAWQEPRRENGHLVPDRNKFPSGMKALGDYIHSKGMKFGMYSSTGHLTCLGLPASYEHEFIDAADFASWGVDYLKYDYCNRPFRIPSEMLYRRMGLALAGCGRDIFFAACSWGKDGTPEWIRGTGASSWRSTGDISDSWSAVRDLACAQHDKLLSGAINCFNDMDMLIVGMRGKGNVAVTGCTDDEYRTHFALWSFMASPLIIGCDVRNIDEESLKILKNKDIIIINQDPDGRLPLSLGGPAPYAFIGKNGYSLSRLLSDGSVAIGMFNMDDDTEISFQFSLYDVGLDKEHWGRTVLKELYTGEEIRPECGFVYAGVKPHCCKIWRLTVE